MCAKENWASKLNSENLVTKLMFEEVESRTLGLNGWDVNVFELNTFISVEKTNMRERHKVITFKSLSREIIISQSHACLYSPFKRKGNWLLKKNASRQTLVRFLSSIITSCGNANFFEKTIDNSQSLRQRRHASDQTSNLLEHEHAAISGIHRTPRPFKGLFGGIDSLVDIFNGCFRHFANRLYLEKSIDCRERFAHVYVMQQSRGFIQSNHRFVSWVDCRVFVGVRRVDEFVVDEQLMRHLERHSEGGLLDVINFQLLFDL